jgi:hypothetical protein
MEEPFMRFLVCIALSIFSASLALATTPVEKEWTMLVYLNGDNSLDTFGPQNLNQMEKVGTTDKINVVVQWGSLARGTTQRLLVKQDNDVNTVTSPVVQDMGKVDMGDYKSLIDFVKWGAQNYPAKHYFIDVWDHGGGWHLSSQHKTKTSEVFTRVRTQPMDISWDDGSGNFFTIHQLGLALKESAKIIGHKVDVYASDACLMAMPEISTEMADSVSVFAGSEETEPGAGWPYDTFLKAWNEASDSSGANVAKLLADLYVKSYEGGENGNQEVTFSAFDLSKTVNFNRAILNLGTSLSSLSATSKAAAASAISNTQNFLYADFGDLGDFIKNLEAAKLPEVKADTLSAVKSAMGEFLLASYSTPGSYSKATGVSIWLPASQDTLNSYWDKYSALQFQQTTHWGDALKALYK